MVNGQFCHGCLGKGWVAPGYGVAVICPVCSGTGVAKEQFRHKTVEPYMDTMWVKESGCPNPMKLD